MPPVPERGVALDQGGRERGIGGVLLGDEPARVVAARAGEVRVDVHATGHDDHAARVERRRAGRQRRDDAAVLDADVAHLAVDPVGRVVDRAADDPKPAVALIAPRGRAPAKRLQQQPAASPPRGARSPDGGERQRDVVHAVAGAGLVDAGDTGVDRDAGTGAPRSPAGPITMPGTDREPERSSTRPPTPATRTASAPPRRSRSTPERPGWYRG